MKLWIGNIAPGTTDGELRELLVKYGAPAVGEITQVPGDGTRPAAMVECPAAPEILQRISQKLNGMYWKGRTLTVQATTR